MRSIADITEDKMVATFLQGELTSERFGPELMRLLQREGVPRSLIDHPNLADPKENARRLHLLGAFRGYRQNRDLFENFPLYVKWQRVALTPAELMQVKYIDYSYWNEISNGTRLPAEAAKTIREGRTIFGMPTDGFLRIADALQQGAVFGEIILVRAAAAADIVVLEGHVRLTVYALVPKMLPAEVTAILGTSPGFVRWGAYGATRTEHHKDA